MSDERDPLLALADAISDGTPVAWDDVLATVPPSSVGPIRALRLIDQIGAACRSVDVTVDPTPETVVTQTSGPTSGPKDPVPTRWGLLERLELVGAGAFGDVFRAWDARLQRLVALKLLRRRDASASSLADRVLTEGRLLARVRHPNVAVVYGVEEHDGRVGTWMEFVEGRTLDALVKARGPFGPREAALVGIELCRALAAVHGTGLLHRDVKAQNVMREDGGRIVLMDFGAGLDAESARGDEGLSGTPLYMAPELLDGERASVESDLYAEGVLLFFLLTGSFPVEADTMPSLMRAHARGQRRRLRDLRPDIPADFASVVQTATAPRPQDRFHTAGALEEALAATLTEKKDASVPAAGIPPKRSLSLRFGVGRFQLTIAATLVIGGIALLLPQWFEEPHTAPPTPVRQPDLIEPAPNEAVVAEGRQGPSPVGSQSATANPHHESNPHPQPVRKEAVPDPTPNPYAWPEPFRPEAAPPPMSVPLSTATAPTPAESFQIGATLFRDHAGTRERLLDGDRVDVGDTLSLDVETSVAMYVYVLHEDDKRQTIVLFPIAGYIPSNPVPAGLHRLPGTLNGKAIDWGVHSAGGHERILVVASRTPLADLDAALVHAPRPTSGADLSYPEVSAGDLFVRAKALATHPETATDIWVRQVDLQNAMR